MPKKVDGISVTTEIEPVEDKIPRVRVFLPRLEEDGTGLKVDQFEHVTINDQTTLIKRGEYVDVTVPVFIQLKNKFPNI